MTERASVFIHLLPDRIAPGALEGGAAVVIDVLRATTVMIHALHSGSAGIAPCLEVDEARGLAASLPPGTAILAGERSGLPIDGFDLANSPDSFDPAACDGKTVVLTTTNGTRAIHAALGADRVLVAAFVNLSATLRVLRVEPRPIHLVASGTNGKVSLEDTLLAGALRDGLAESHPGDGNDEAILAADAWREGRRGPLAEAIGRGIGGRRVRAIGLEADLIAAARVDRFDLVAEAVRGPLRIVRVA